MEVDLYLQLLNTGDLNNINDEERELIVIKFWTLLGKITERYTMGDSTSITVEIAEELLESICFLLKREIRNCKNKIEILMNKDLEVLLKESWLNIEDDIKKSRELLQEVIEKSIGIDNISYFDTLAEIGEGIKNYDYRFFAHKVQCSIDYQLSNAVSEELQGIEYINEYLKRLLFENEFCNNFNRENIIEVLKSYCNDYKELLINIFEPVVTNAIGLDILEKDILKLEITSYESERLLNIFNSMNTDDIKKTVLKSIDNICNILDINSSIKINYMKMTALNLVSRIEEAVRNNNLQNIFLGFKEDKNIVNEVFVDNKTMDNEKLRELIDEISSCRFTEDKIIIIHNEVTSLEDLVEILNNCIWEDEVECLLRNISSDEINLLKYYLNNKSKDSISNTGWENKFNMLTK